MAVTLNASTSTGYIQTADTSGDLALQSNGTTQFTVASTGAYGQLKASTVVTTTGGTSIDFTSLPSWAKRITVMFNGLSLNSTSTLRFRLGTSGAVETSGYVGTAINSAAAPTVQSFTAGFDMYGALTAATAAYGAVTFSLIGSNAWVANGIIATSLVGANSISGTKTLAGTLDMVRITTVSGIDTFDANGGVNILYEG